MIGSALAVIGVCRKYDERPVGHSRRVFIVANPQFAREMRSAAEATIPVTSALNSSAPSSERSSARVSIPHRCGPFPRADIRSATLQAVGGFFKRSKIFLLNRLVDSVRCALQHRG